MEMEQRKITAEAIVAYTDCPTKAFLLMCSAHQGVPHEYAQILELQAENNLRQYLHSFIQKHPEAQDHEKTRLENGDNFLLNATLAIDDLEVFCAVLSKVQGESCLGNFYYEPTICVGSYRITKRQRLEAIFACTVLEQIQAFSPECATIVTLDGRSHRMKLGNACIPLYDPIREIRQWKIDSSDPPPLVLNRSCPICQFRHHCKSKAQQDDNPSLLDRVTAKTISKYEKKGIFTIKQLSFVFKPRRPRKRAKKHVLTHNIELQALSLRENKMYVQELPIIAKQPVELMVDIEGVPDQQLYYLIGLLVCDGEKSTYYPFWADAPHDEEVMWHAFLKKLELFAGTPIYHYGSYEPKAFAKLAKRYETDNEFMEKRLVNVNSYIHAKVYFPVYSNSLKDLGAFLGATWTAPNASGLQSLVWRHYWEQTHDTQYKKRLLTYNAEDCYALEKVVTKLYEIALSSATLDDVDFADKRKQPRSVVGQEVHEQFNDILKMSYLAYEHKKISFAQSEKRFTSQEQKHKNKSYGAYKSKEKRVLAHLKATRVIKVPREKLCSVCGHKLFATNKTATRVIIDIVSTRSGIKKTLTKYVGAQGYCRQCYRHRSPSGILKYRHHQIYGHGFKAWAVYQRVGLRLPYNSIREAAKEYFGEDVNRGTFINFVKELGAYYTKTEEIIIQHLLKSPFIHADETAICVKGVNQYVWVFTDGKHVLFRLTETREPTIVHELLTDYTGVLISDFYPGYDAIPCTQQKCWVHLIRDLNTDLLEAPFDSEFEGFALKIKNLIVPIMVSVQKYGVKRYHLHKYAKDVDKFYNQVITVRHYKSEIVNKYQKRFVRYRDSLFTFLEIDGISWHNNLAERAIRHVAKQRAISMHFVAPVMKNYLILLGVKQACRFQKKSFFKFLLSEELDLDHFGKRTYKRRDITLISGSAAKNAAAIKMKRTQFCKMNDKTSGKSGA